MTEPTPAASSSHLPPSPPEISTFGPSEKTLPQINNEAPKKYSLEEAVELFETTQQLIGPGHLENGEKTFRRLSLLTLRPSRNISLTTLLWTFAFGVIMGVALFICYGPQRSVVSSSQHSFDGHLIQVPTFASAGKESTILPLQKGTNGFFLIQGKHCSSVNTTAKPDLMDIHYSMQRHLHSENLKGLSAFSVGRPQCYLMLLGERNQTIAMANPSVVQVNWDRTVTVAEPSIYCDKETKMTRSLQIWVAYQDPFNNWERMERRLAGSRAWAFQTELAILNGLSVCDETDRGVESLHRFLRE